MRQDTGNGKSLASFGMNRISSHRDLIVWQKAVTLAGKVYAATARFPNRMRQGLAEQMERAAVSVASNIAEGSGRGGRPEFIRFLNIARGSLSELETQALIAIELGWIGQEQQLEEAISETGRLLTALIQRLHEKRTPAQPG